MFEDWEMAAKASKTNKAWAKFGSVPDRNGKLMPAEIVMEARTMTATIRYKHTAIIIRRASASEVDSTRGWRPF